jgi:superoxide dismutase, Cu-Zn family
MRRMVMAGAMLIGCATMNPKDDEELFRPTSAATRAPKGAAPTAASMTPTATATGSKAAEMPVTAEVRIDPMNASGVRGSGRFAVERGVVTMDLVFSNVPQGAHALSLQDSCEGEHWNPTMSAHGRFDMTPFHLGDVGNFFANDLGQGSLTFTTELWSIGTGLSNDVVDRYVVVRENKDDFATQPLGNAGKVLGCGRIEMSQLTQPAVSMTGRLIDRLR